MFSNPVVRLAIGIPAALIISLALFMLMERLTRVDSVQLNEDNTRSLRNIFAEKSTVESVRTTRKAPQKLDKANKPPPPPKMSATKQNVDLPTPSIQGAAPTEIKFERVTNIDVGAVVVNDRDAQPVRPPNQGPLLRALQRVGKDAECEVRLDVDVRGKPYNVKATCNLSSYERAAEQAVSAAEFAPKIVKGKPAERRGVVYPIELRLAQ